MIYVIPAVILLTVAAACLKRKSVYDSFIAGTKESWELIISLLPYLAAVFMLIEIFRVSGVSQKISDVLAIPLSWLGIPKELCELLILRPLSGSGSLAVVEKIFADYGVDSYVARCASVIMAANDTVLYITAVYLSTSKHKSSGAAIPISLFTSLLGAVTACLLCRIM